MHIGVPPRPPGAAECMCYATVVGYKQRYIRFQRVSNF